MGGLLVDVDSDEMRGLDALVEFARASGEEGAQAEAMARTVLKKGLAARLAEVGLPWDPTPEAVAELARARTEALTRASRPPERRTIALLIALGLAVAVVLVGGYAGGWAWTGFQANGQVWDWLHLLLLPVAFGTLPLWLQYAEQMSRARRGAMGLVVGAFAVLVVVGYLAPLGWTGFRGNTLWDWLTLIVLPITLITIRVWPQTGRELRPHHIGLVSVLATGWVVALIGGYALNWKWTGFHGNTLWDWLQLLLLPLVFPTILLPAFLRWTSGNAEQRAREVSERTQTSA